MQNLKRGNFIGSVIECDFLYNNDFTVVRVSDNLETISIHGSGEASLKIAVEMNKQCNFPLRMTDVDYGFDIELMSVDSVTKLQSLILGAKKQT